MSSRSILLLAAARCAGNAWADLKPDIIDCDAKKAARNAALDATVGVSGGCDSAKVAKDTRDDMVDGAQDAVDKLSDKKPAPLDKGKNKLRPNKD